MAPIFSPEMLGVSRDHEKKIAELQVITPARHPEYADCGSSAWLWRCRPRWPISAARSRRWWTPSSGRQRPSRSEGRLEYVLLANTFTSESLLTVQQKASKSNRPG